MQTLDKRNEHYGLDCRISPLMLSRHEIMSQDTASSVGTGVSVQELINALCDLTDGEAWYDITSSTGLEEDHAKRIIEIRQKVAPMWTYPDGRPVIDR